MHCMIVLPIIITIHIKNYEIPLYFIILHKTKMSTINFLPLDIYSKKIYNRSVAFIYFSMQFYKICAEHSITAMPFFAQIISCG